MARGEAFAGVFYRCVKEALALTDGPEPQGDDAYLALLFGRGIAPCLPSVEAGELVKGREAIGEGDLAGRLC